MTVRGSDDAPNTHAEPPKVYIRFGDIPEGERSGIGASPNVYKHLYRRSDHEVGVSVYDVDWDASRNLWALDVYNVASAADLIDSAMRRMRKVYLVSGHEVTYGDLTVHEKELVEWNEDGWVRGIDNEPLLRDVSILQELTCRDFYGPGFYNPDEDYLSPEDYGRIDALYAMPPRGSGPA